MRNYNTKSHKKYLLQAHIIFSTKYRKPILQYTIGEELKKKIEEIAETSRFVVVTQEVDRNHIHILVSYEPNISISQIIRKIKSETTYHAWNKYEEILKCEYYKKHKLWADGYFVCSVGDASEETIRNYIENQG
jgi:putative transposase